MLLQIENTKNRVPFPTLDFGKDLAGNRFNFCSSDGHLQQKAAFISLSREKFQWVRKHFRVAYTNTIVKEESGKTIHQLITALGSNPANYCVLAEAFWSQRALRGFLMPTCWWCTLQGEMCQSVSVGWNRQGAELSSFSLNRRGVGVLSTLQDHSTRENFIRDLCQRNN